MSDTSPYASLQEEISGKIFPIPTVEFIKLYLPQVEIKSARAPDVSVQALQKLEKATTEAEICLAFMEAFQKDLNTITIVDSRAHELPPIDNHVISPPLIVVDNNSRSTTPFIEDVELMVTVKVTDEDNPFNNNASSDFVREGAQAVETLGQMTAYATAQMAAQFRSHIFSLLVFPTYARILRWDRAGVVVTHEIPFCQAQAQELAEFLWRYDQASPIERGIDPNVVRVPRRSVPPEVRAELGYFEHAYYRIAFPASGCKSGRDLTFIIATSQYMGLKLPVGRSSRCFKAYCETTEEYVFLKDTWRIQYPGLKPEHETYARLAAAGVEFVATSSAHHDLQAARTVAAVKYIEGKPSEQLKFKNLQNYRIVLDQFGKPVSEFANLREMVQVFRDCIKAHGDAFKYANILHCDISPANIMIYNGRGLLIDWDLSKDMTQQMTQCNMVPKCVGTLRYLSIRLERAMNETLCVAPHDREDDIESFWFSLYWLSLMRGEHDYNSNQLVKLMAPIFERLEFVDGELRETHAARYTALEDEIAGIHSLPLRKLLRRLQTLARTRNLYTTEYKAIFKKVFEETTSVENWPDFKSDTSIAEVERRMRDRVASTPAVAKHLDKGPRLRTTIYMLDPERPLMLFDEALAEPGADWGHRGGNVDRADVYEDDSTSLVSEAVAQIVAEHHAVRWLKSWDNNLERDETAPVALGSPFRLKRKLPSEDDSDSEPAYDEKENRQLNKRRRVR